MQLTGKLQNTSPRYRNDPELPLPPGIPKQDCFGQTTVKFDKSISIAYAMAYAMTMKDE